MIGAILAGYFILLSKSSDKNETTLKLTFALGCLGFVFTIGWYFVNRGSKFWQVNWEKHLNFLEDDFVGPLYKTTINRKSYTGKFWDLTGPYPFSVTKVNQVLNLILSIFWLILLIEFTYSNLNFSVSFIMSFYSLMIIFTIASILCLYSLCHTGIDFKFGKVEKGIRNATKVDFEKRGVIEGSK